MILLLIIYLITIPISGIVLWKVVDDWDAYDVHPIIPISLFSIFWIIVLLVFIISIIWEKLRDILIDYHIKRLTK